MSRTATEVLTAYNNIAYLYDVLNKIYFFGKDKKYRTMLATRLIRKPNDTILVICCGTGLDFPFLYQEIKKQGTLIGIDLSQQMLHRAKTRIGNKADLIRSETSRLPFQDKIFDHVLFSFCLKITPTYKRAIDEAARVLKHDGRIGVLANQKPSGLLWLPGIIITKILSIISKIDYEANLEEHLSKRFRIYEKKKLHGGFVQLLIGKTL